MTRRKRAETRRELKQKAVKFKGGHCEVCGYDRCLAALTFHHRDPTKKDFGISDVMTTIPWHRIKKELMKTVLLCTNCHSEVHEGILDGYL